MPNEQYDLIFETTACDELWSILLQIEEGEKLYKFCNGGFNKAKCNYPTMERENLAMMREIEKFLIFSIP